MGVCFRVYYAGAISSAVEMGKSKITDDHDHYFLFTRSRNHVRDAMGRTIEKENMFCGIDGTKRFHLLISEGA